MKQCPIGLALPVMLVAVAWGAPGLAQAPLSSWNDTASKTAIVGFVERVTKPEMVYQPMIELLDHLRANGFTTFILGRRGCAFDGHRASHRCGARIPL